MRRTIVLTGGKLAVLAAVLVAIICIAAAVFHRTASAAEAKAAAESVSKDSGQVTASELARWIVDKKQDYQLVDLRDPWQFDDYHIPGAINVPFDNVFTGDNLGKIDKSKKIVVYGLGAGRSAQTQLLLAMKGYRALALTDGIIAWWDEVMTPTSLRSATPSSSGYQQARQMREYFQQGGRVVEPPAAAAVPAKPIPPPPPAAAAPKPAAPAKAAVKEKPAKAEAKSAAKPAAKPEGKPAKTPAETVPPKDKDSDRLKLGAGCS